MDQTVLVAVRCNLQQQEKKEEGAVEAGKGEESKAQGMHKKEQAGKAVPKKAKEGGNKSKEEGDAPSLPFVR